ncbi:hypothetical protein F4780DRAFT_58664 [Xylariomycetidae sp. FL0641]|nr:hypothetical protein F4780DRAFT_58664 [Xylariomycetidae sp. FL0641]
MSADSSRDWNEKASPNSPTLTHAPTVSDHEGNHEDSDKRGMGHKPSHLRIPTHSDDVEPAYFSPASQHSRNEQADRLVDDLTLLQAERAVSNNQDFEALDRANSRVYSRDSGKEDIFNMPQETPAVGLIATEPSSRMNQVFKLIKKLPRFVRYFLYSLPITAILLIPILLGIFIPKQEQAVIGGHDGVQLLWFGIWLEIVWLSLWASRIVTSIMPYMLGLVAKIMGSGNFDKWKDIGRQLELHMALFLWMLACMVSFKPIMNTHRVLSKDPEKTPEDVHWVEIVYKVIIGIFVLAVLNFVEKILMQWIAMSFHLRTYSMRIDTNKQNIAYLVHLYEHSKDRLVSEASVLGGELLGSGTKTPLGMIGDNAREVATKVGDIANRVAGDFTGKQIKLSNHPRKVVSELLRNTGSAQVLARRLFRTFAQNGADVLTPHDLNPAFPTPEDAEAAFSIFDRDLNGDVSMDELEAFCDEVHREKKAIAASLKDLDSVVTKLDQVFFVIIFIIAVIVFISIISSSTAAALASAGTAVLGLAWVLQATAQEFLQSIIFVFVKHPFDVGDRVTVYGNTGSTLTGDDYYVTEISLLYTEFKKMEGHIVQAPNSLLNNLFILNHRRSGQLADVFTLRMKYGTPPSVIKELEARMTEWVQENKRDYTSKIITELTGFEDVYCMSVNFICFHKTSFQNELLRLIRHNKFAIELMTQMVDLGIEQPRRQYQVAGRDFPIYQTNIAPPTYEEEQHHHQMPAVDPAVLRATRRRANSRAADPSDMFQDVFISRKASNNPAVALKHPPRINEESTAAEASGTNLPNKTLEKITSNQSGRGSGRNLFHRSFGHARRSLDQQTSRSDRDMV